RKDRRVNSSGSPAAGVAPVAFYRSRASRAGRRRKSPLPHILRGGRYGAASWVRRVAWSSTGCRPWRRGSKRAHRRTGGLPAVTVRIRPGTGSPQRFGRRDGQLAGVVRMPRAERVLADLQTVEHRALHRLCTADNDPYTSRPVEIAGGDV